MNHDASGRDKSAHGIHDPSSRLSGDAQGVVAPEFQLHFRELIDALPVALYVTDIHGVITMYNRAAAEIWGREPVVGKESWCGSFRIYKPDGTPVPLDNCFMAECVKTGKVARYSEVIVERPDGTRRRILPHPQPLRDAEGNLIGAINMLVDLTPLHEMQQDAQRSLRESQERFSRFMQHLPGLAWIKDNQGRYVYANEVAQRVFGKTTTELYGKTDDEVFTDEVASRFRANDEAALAGAGVQVVESLEHDDGEVHHSLVSKFPIPAVEKNRSMVGGIAIDITDRKRAEEALRESEQRFRLMADAAPVLIWVSDEQKRGIYFNETWLKFTGRTLEQELGFGWMEGIHPDDRARAEATCRDAFERAEPFRMEFRIRTTDGKYRWLLDHAVPRFSEAGTLAGYIGSCIDVTDQRQAIEEMRANEARLRMSLQAGRMGTWEWSIDTGRVVWSPDLEQLHGLAPGSFGGTFDDFQRDIHPDDRADVLRNITRALESGEDLKHEYRILLSDGTQKWVEGRGKLVRDDEGNPVRMTGVCVDITERRQDEQARAFLASIVESTQDVVISKTLDGQILSWNSAAEKLFGYTAAEAVGQSIELIVPTDLHAEERQILERLRCGARIEHFETVRCAKDGQRIDVSLTISPMRDSSGRLIGASSVAHDVSPRKRAEESFRRQFETLQTLYRLTAAVAQTTSVTEITEATLDALLDGAGADRASVLLFDDDGAMRFKGWRGLSDGYRAAVEGHSPWGQEDCAATPITVRDIETDETLASFRPTIRAEGIRALAFIPVKSATRVLGKFMVYYNDVHDFIEDELQFCEALARHVAFAVERARGEQALRESELRYRAVVENQSEMLCRFRIDGTILFANEAYARARNSSAGALRGTNFWQFIPEDEHALVRGMLSKLTPDSPEIRVENQFRTDRGLRWVLWTNRALAFDEHGVPEELQSTGVDITERKRAEDALRESEARFRRMADATPVLIWMSGRAKMRTWFSKPWLKFVGRAMEREIGSGWLENIHPDDRQRCEQVYDDSFMTGQSFTTEYRLRRHDGEYRWMLEQASPLTSVGEVCGYIGSCVDITDRKNTEAALRAKEAELDLVARTTPMILTRCSRDLRYLFANRAAAALFGTTPEEMINRPIIDVQGEAAFNIIKPHIEKVLGGEETEFEAQIAYPKAGMRWVRGNYIPERDEQGQVVGWVASIVDITERKQAEEAQRQSEERLRLALQGASAGVWLLDIATGETYWSDEFLPLYGYHESTPRTFEQWISSVHPDDRQRVQENFLARVQSTQTEFRQEFRIVHPARGVRWVFDMGHIERDSEGAAIRCEGINIDITERKEAEEMLRIRARQQQAVAQLGEIALRERNLQELFDQATRTVAETLDVELCKVLELQPNGRSLLLRAAVGFNPGLVGIATVMHSLETQAGFTLHADAPVVVSDLASETRFHGPRLLFDHGVVSGMSCVIRATDGRPWGVLGTHARRHVVFTPDDVSFLVAVANILGSAIDRERAEDALRISEQQFRSAVQDAPVPVILQADDGEVLQISRTMTTLTGYTLEDAPLFQSWLTEAYGAATHDVRDRSPTMFAKSDEVRGIEFNVTTRSGEHRQWLLSASSPGRLRDGRRYVVAMAQDITSRKRIEHALRESEARFRNMADYAPVLIWVNNLGGCEFVNREYLRFVGRPFNEVRDMRWTQFVHPDDLESYVGTYTRAMDEAKPFEAEVRIRRADGEYRWLHSAGLPRFTSTGELMGYVGCSSDITEQIQARQALERHGAELEAAVAQRSAQLEESNQRLRLAERMASLGTLSAGLGHDIGNILIPVRVRLESLAAADLPAELLEHIEVIRTSTEYLQRLSGGLRMLASDSRGSTRAEAILVSDWWKDAQPMLANGLPRGVKLTANTPKEECWIGISRAGLTQIVFNLVQNAGEATKDRVGGQVGLFIEPDGEFVRVRVSDNGQGMTEEVQRRCLEPFFTTKPRGLSTGLGLSLIHSIVNDVGGTIEIESELGVGTTFTITLKQVHRKQPIDQNGQVRLATVHLADARLRAYVSAELRALKYDVAFGLERLSESTMVIVDDDESNITPPDDAAMLVLNGQSASDGSANGHVAPAGRNVMVAEARPQAIRKAIYDLAQKYMDSRNEP